MKIKKIMTQDVEVIHPDTSLKDAAEKMKTLDVGLLPVCDGQLLVGMVTDRDITVRSTAKGLEPTKTRASDVMTTEVVYCFDDQDVRDAVKLMEEKQIRRLPILDRDKRLVGLVSLGDLAVRTGDQRLAGKAIKEVSEPAQPNR